MRLYTDGSCFGNPGPGGWGCICVDDSDSVIFKIGGGDSNSTNNIMELTAVIRGIERHGVGPLTIFTDSKYVKNGIDKWIYTWKANGWKTSCGGFVKNKTLWKQLDDLMTPMITIEWVKAHDGNYWNEAVDRLAKEYLLKSSSPLCKN